MNERLLDAVGWAILAALQDDARLTYNDLGRRVGLSPPAVTERVRRMEEAGIITGYRAEVDAARLGWPLLAFMRIVTPGGQDARFHTAIRAMPEIVECHRVTGSDSFILRVRITSMAHLEALIDRLKPFGQSMTSLVLSSPVERRALVEPLDAAR